MDNYESRTSGVIRRLSAYTADELEARTIADGGTSVPTTWIPEEYFMLLHARPEVPSILTMDLKLI